MSDLQKLADHRAEILRAEIAGMIHDVGKLETTFLLSQTDIGDLGAEVERYNINLYTPWAYKYWLFVVPSIVENKSKYQKRKGALYFADLEKRQRIEEIPKASGEKPLGEASLRSEQASSDSEEKQALDQLKRSEFDTWCDYQKRIEELKFDNGWPLGSLLTLSREDSFKKPKRKGVIVGPGTGNDPDYSRKPKPSIKLSNNLKLDSYPLLLLLSHGEISGQEKKGIDCSGNYVGIKGSGKVAFNGLRLATAFGYEAPVEWKTLADKRRKIIDWVLEHWDKMEQAVEEISSVFEPFRNALGDTRRPVNEISLWDYSRAISALFKAAVAQWILTGKKPTAQDMHWRLASVRLDAFEFLSQADQIPDLIAKKQLLDNVWDAIRHAFEVDTPIGSVVYADEHGLVFVLPGWPGKSDEEIRRIVQARVDEVIGLKNSSDKVAQDSQPFYATDVHPVVSVGKAQRGKKLFLTEVLPCEEPINMPEPAVIEKYWANHHNLGCCHVCGLRPVGYVEPEFCRLATQEKAVERNVCGVCLERRGRRCKEWVGARLKKEESYRKNPKGTIWIDEVADGYGRLALVVGKFDLDNWLDGKLVRSIARGISTEGVRVGKVPTFARIQRVWRTTDEFWQQIQKNVLNGLSQCRPRLLLRFEREPDLERYCAYELDIKKTTISVVWCPGERNQKGYLISAVNLGYVARQLCSDSEGKTKDYKDPVLAAKMVQKWIEEKFVKERREPALRDPDKATSEHRNLLSGNRIVRAELEKTDYTTVIPILAEPRTFMVLVPADKALWVVNEIQNKYRREMGKVLNRLPLHVGVVFARRRTPLRVILDAGRQFLKQKPLGGFETWTVRRVRWYPKEFSREEKNWVSDDIHFNTSVAVELEQKGRLFTWYVPLKMGDGKTEDGWYPYAYWKQNANGETDPRNAGRNHFFESVMPGVRGAEKCWLVRADDLRKGDEVYFASATFDFEWLDTNARRFEISYNAYGQRCSKPSRPYLLCDLERLSRMWHVIKKLTISQRYQVIRSIEATREAWYGRNFDQSLEDDVFRQFVSDTLAGAKWPETFEWKDISQASREELIKAGVRGELADVVEIYMEILKER